MAHVVHLVVVARKNNYDVSAALNQVCIGSDYDGLINPIWTCETANGLEYFKSQFEDSFVSFAKESRVALPNGFDIKTFKKKSFLKMDATL